MQASVPSNESINLQYVKKIFNLLRILFLVSSFSCSTPNVQKNEKYTCLQGDCINGYGIQEFNRGIQKTSRYEGTFKNGKFDGKGTYHFENKDRYSGSFVEGKISGNGVYEYFETGDTYKGEFKDDRMEGIGVYTTKKGNRYEGNFQNGKMNGEGKLYRKGGEVLIGNFKDDYPNGKAVIKNNSGKVIFDGEFLEK